MPRSLRLLVTGTILLAVTFVLSLQSSSFGANLARVTLRKDWVLPQQLFTIFSGESDQQLNSKPIVGIFT